MCPPDYFAIDYEINPWMKKSNKVKPSKAYLEWQSLKDTYTSLGCKVEVLAPAKGWPDLVFTANSGLCIGKEIILSRFRYPQRQGEAKFNAEWFLSHGYKVHQPNLPFEGQGESFLFQGKIFLGFGFRSQKETAKELESLTGLEVVPLHLIDPRFYHLDMAFAPIGDNLIVYNPKAFDKSSLQALRSLTTDKIEVDKTSSDLFACNLVPIGRTIVAPKSTKSFAESIKGKGYSLIELDMSEFQKSGGGVRCLTLNLI